MPVPLSFFSSSKRFSRVPLLLAIFCLPAFCWLARLQAHNTINCYSYSYSWHKIQRSLSSGECCFLYTFMYMFIHTHLSEMATASGSVGGIMKQTAGAVILRPAASFTSHLVPLLRSRVYLSPRKIWPCTQPTITICYLTANIVI